MSMFGISLAGFLTSVFTWCKERLIMKKTLRIRTALEPNRLGAEHCRRAYEVLLPMGRRLINDRVPKLTEGGFEVAAVPTTRKVENER